jgi:hypothetical protein
MKKIAAAAILAALASTLVVSSADARPWHRHGGVWAGAATGLVVGGVLAAGAYGPYGYYQPGYYYAPPGPGYVQAPRQRNHSGNCTRSVRQDMYGQPFDWWDCN